MAVTKRIPKGSPLTAQEMDDNLSYFESQLQAGTSGTAGSAGTSGTSGTSGGTGASGTSGSSGSGGTSGQTGDKFATTSSDSRAIIASGTLYFNIGLGLKWTAGQQMLIAYDSSNTMNATVTTYDPANGSLEVSVYSKTGTGTYSAWAINTLGAPGQKGTDGTSGTSGQTGTSGTSGIDGTTGTAGSGGTAGTSGTSGTSGISGTNGLNGTNFGSAGTSGVSGTSGTSGTSGVSGTNGTAGSGGTSGISGTNATAGSGGTSGISGTSGTSGVSGTGGTSGLTGTAGSGGTSGSSGTSVAGSFSGTTLNGVITFNAPSPTVNSNLLFDGSKLTINGSVSASNSFTASLASGYAWVGGTGNVSRLVATSSFGSGIFTQVAGNIYASSNDIQITGSLSASLASGYMWVGGANNVSRLILTSSLGASLTARNYSGNSFGATAVNNVTTLAFSGSAIDVLDMGGGLAKIVISAAAGTGNAGTNGTSGTSGLAGTSGLNGSSGTSGANGFGSSGSSGTNGTSGRNGTDGFTGTSGTGGTSGIDGSSGSSGTSGISAATGTNGTSGINGTMGTSGISGTSGTSGVTVNGSNGTNGTSGTSGNLILTGSTPDGVLTYDPGLTQGVVEQDFRWNATGKVMTVSGSLDLYSGIHLVPNQYPPTATAGMLYASGGLAGQTYLMFHNGSTWLTVQTY